MLDRHLPWFPFFAVFAAVLFSGTASASAQTTPALQLGNPNQVSQSMLPAGSWQQPYASSAYQLREEAPGHQEGWFIAGGILAAGGLGLGAVAIGLATSGCNSSGWFSCIGHGIGILASAIGGGAMLLTGIILNIVGAVRWADVDRVRSESGGPRLALDANGIGIRF